MTPNNVLSELHLCSALRLPPISAESKARITADTPQSLRDLVHYAILWGISDDGYRWDLVHRATPELRANLKQVLAGRDDEFDEWLAGPEAEGPTFTDAYIAFSAMRMAADEIPMTNLRPTTD